MVQVEEHLAAADAKEAAEVARLLRSLNNWAEGDAQRYMQGVLAVAARRSDEGGWRLDLGRLGELGVEVPPPLQDLC